MFANLNLATGEAPVRRTIRCTLRAEGADFQGVSGEVSILVQRTSDGLLQVEVDSVALTNAARTVRIERSSMRLRPIGYPTDTGSWVQVGGTLRVTAPEFKSDDCYSMFTITERSPGAHDATLFIRDPRDPDWSSL